MIQEFLLKIVTLAVKYEFSVTSWLRTEKRNKLVGGVDSTYHLFGLAVDIVLDNVLERPDFIKDAEKLGLKVVLESDHIHIQVK